MLLRYINCSIEERLRPHVLMETLQESQCPLLEAGVPSDHCSTGSRKTVKCSASLRKPITGEPTKPAPQFLGSGSDRKNIKCGRQCPSRSLRYPCFDIM